MRNVENDLLVRVMRFRAMLGLETTASQFNGLFYGSRQGTINIIFNSFERMAGYVAWARLSKESLRMAMDSGQFKLIEEDLNEGHFLLIYDLAVRPFSVGNLRSAFESIPGRFRCILYVRKGILTVLRVTKGRIARHHRRPIGETKFIA